MKKSKDAYTMVKKILMGSPRARNSDKVLMWMFWGMELEAGEVMRSISLGEFIQVTTPETITRARRKVVENYPELKGVEDIEEKRRQKQELKGTFIYE